MRVVEAAAKKHGPQWIQTIAVDQLSGDLARVTYTFATAELNQKEQPWNRENGQWRYDAC